MGTSGYAVATPKRIPRISGANRIARGRQYIETEPMKLTFKQKLRNWLLNDDDVCETAYADESGPEIQSNAFRLNIYGASGGTIVETTKYDCKKDENRHSLHVVTEDKDLGEELSKIITMEQLRS
jgi:hypothetical protein